MGRADLSFLALSAIALLCSCRKAADDTPIPNGIHAPERQAELQMNAMHLQSYGDNGLEWELLSPVGEMFTRKNVMRVKDMTVQLFEGGQKSTDITARQGILSTANRGDNDPILVQTIFGVNLEQGDMYLSGDVVMVSTDGTKMTTDWAHYHRRTDLITSTAPVTVERQDSTTHGIGMEASSDMTRVHIFNETLVIPGKRQ